MLRRLAVFLVLPLVAACGPIGSPSANPDHGPPKPPNGYVLNPVRPGNIPDGAFFMSWHVLALDENWEEGPHIPVRVHVEAVGNAPVQGNVHGIYPFDEYIYTPYTHTIWYQPGIEITTNITAFADPVLGSSSEVAIVCVASSTNNTEELIDESQAFIVQDYCRASWSTITGEN